MWWNQTRLFLQNLKEELRLTEEKEINWIVKVIIFEKCAKGILLWLLSLTFFPIFSDQMIDFLHTLARRSHILSNARFVTRLFLRVESLTDRRLLILSLFFLVWGSIELLEGIGLSKRRRWAEYLIVVSTGLFIPVELATIFTRFTIEKLLLLAFNVFLIIYLIWSRDLFTFEELKHSHLKKK